MTASAPVRENALGLLLPAVLLLGLVTVVAGQLGAIGFPSASEASPETVTIEPREFTYRAPGEFQKLGSPVNGPLLTVSPDGPLEIMRYQVSVAEYARCVSAGSCASEQKRAAAPDWPVTGVSFEDATDYADWLSAATGSRWRVPTAQEWAFAAGSKAVDHAVKLQTDSDNPAARWIAAYDQEAAAKVDGPALPGASGSFGMNEFGVADLSANVWEWTSTCFSRTTLAEGGPPVSVVESCGIRYLEGRHRSPMNVFVKDARGGGCSVGVPPDNLGIRLVRNRPVIAALTDWLVSRFQS